MSNILLPQGWRTDGINRWRIGPYSSFGKGVTVDIDGNNYKHLLETDALDHSPVYGDIDLLTEEENNFELSYRDQNDDPDYANNLDSIDDFKDKVNSEPVYICIDANVAPVYPAGLTVYTEFGPLILGELEILPSGYTSGTDVNLNNPNDQFDFTDFSPIGSGGDTGSGIQIGDYFWANELEPPGNNAFHWGHTVGSTYGSVKFITEYNDWWSFAASSFNGVQTITLPKFANEDDLGGSFSFYYHRDAWYTAFNGNNSDVIIAKDGSVFKGSITYANLVVSGRGHIGTAGGGDTSEFTLPYIYIKDKNGNFKTEVIDYTLEEYDNINQDRLATYPSAILMSNKIVINSFPDYPAFEWEDGDIVFVTYTYFHHSDMIRDGKLYSVWSTAKGKTSSYITMDVSPIGNVNLLQEINNVELVSHSSNFPLGGSEYIIQAGIPDAHGRINYKVLTSGYLPLIKNGESTVIKFEKISLRFLRIILIGSPMGSYTSIDVISSDPNLPSVLTVSDLYSITAIPYYVNSSASDVQSTLCRGNPILVSEVVHDNIGRLYIPQYNVDDILERKNYILSHFDLRIGTSFIYKGLPSTFLGQGTYIIGDESIEKIGVTDPLEITADVYLPIKYDLVSRNTTSKQYFKTMFGNIDEFRLYLIRSNGAVEPLVEGASYDYSFNNVTGDIEYYDGLDTNEQLKAMYTFVVIKLNDTQIPEKYLNFIRAKSNLESIVYSDLRIFTSKYFMKFIVNDDTLVYEFEVNPSSMTDAPSSKSSLIELLDGSVVKQTFGRRRSKLSISGEKISDAMYDKLKEFEETVEPLGIVTDVLEFKKVIIVPNSLKGTRRKTTKGEYEGMTTTWSYTMEVQEV